jgi:hypothetical protein
VPVHRYNRTKSNIDIFCISFSQGIPPDSS